MSRSGITLGETMKDDYPKPGRLGPAAPQPGDSGFRRRRRITWPAAVVAVSSLLLTVGVPGLAAASPGLAHHRAAARDRAAVAFPEVEIFTYQGPVTQTVIVPAGAVSASVQVIGARGGYTEGTCCPLLITRGGPGAVVTGLLPVSPGQRLSIRVGQYGGNANLNRSPGPGGWGATGNGARGGSGSNRDGGGGGGSSSLAIDGAVVAIAAGGGGGGGMGFIDPADSGGSGGSGDATAGGGVNGSGPGAGKGGRGGGQSTAAGGAGGNGSSVGGGGGGGGSGVAGGSGGGGGGFGAGGGGGGGAGSSSYTAPLTSATIGRSGDETNGRVIIRWNGTSQPPECLNQTISVPRNSPGVPFRLLCADLSRPEIFQILTLPDHGFLDNRNFTAGTFTYVPDTGYTGTDSLTFRAVSGGLASAPATVTFLVG
jgi:Bacterial Ig domain